MVYCPSRSFPPVPTLHFAVLDFVCGEGVKLGIRSYWVGINNTHLLYELAQKFRICWDLGLQFPTTILICVHVVEEMCVSEETENGVQFLDSWNHHSTLCHKALSMADVVLSGKWVSPHFPEGGKHRTKQQICLGHHVWRRGKWQQEMWKFTAIHNRSGITKSVDWTSTTNANKEHASFVLCADLDCVISLEDSKTKVASGVFSAWHTLTNPVKALWIILF